METDPLIAIEQAARNAKAMQSKRRSRCIRIYLTAAEAQSVLEACQGMPASIYCRTKVLGQSVPRPRRQIPVLNRLYYTELSRLGMNLNQVTKSVNYAIATGQQLPLNESFLHCLQELKAALRLHSLAVAELVNGALKQESNEDQNEGYNDADW